MPVGDSAKDVAQRLAAFINERGGKVEANILGQFYALHPSAKAKMTGGAKKFCEAYPDLLRFETVKDSPGFLHATPTVAGRLHRIVASNGGDMSASKCFAQFYADYPRDKAALKCGAAKFCSEHPDLLRFVKDASGGRVLSVRPQSGDAGKSPGSNPPRPEPPKDGAGVAKLFVAKPSVVPHTELGAVSLLREFVKGKGGEMDCGLLTQFYEKHAWAKVFVGGNNGARGFCERHKDTFRFENRSGPTWLCLVKPGGSASRSAKTELCQLLPNCPKGESCTYAHSESELRPKPSKDKAGTNATVKDAAPAGSSWQPKTDVLAVAQELRVFIRERGGKLEFSHITKFYKEHPSALPVVKECGGLDKFCGLHKALFVIHATGKGQPFILLAPGVGAAAAAESLPPTSSKSADASGNTSAGSPAPAGDGGSAGVGPDPWVDGADPWSAAEGNAAGGSTGSPRPQERTAEATEPGDVGATAAAVGSHLASSAAVHVRETAADGAEAAPSCASTADGHGLSGGRGGTGSPDGSAANPRCGADVAAGTGIVLGHAGGRCDSSGDFAVAEGAAVAPVVGRVSSGIATPCGGTLAGLVDVGARCFVLRECSVFASTTSWETLRGLRVGDELVAAGAPEYAAGYLMLPILPVGAVQLECLEILEAPAPQAAPVPATAPKQADVGCGAASVVATLADDQPLGGPRGCEQAGEAAGVPDDAAAPRPPAPNDVGDRAAACFAWEQSLLAREERLRCRLAALALREEHLRRREEQRSHIEHVVAPQVAVASSPACVYSFASDRDFEHVD